MTMELERKVTIQRPVEEVFAYMSNAENDQHWRTNVKWIEREGGGERSDVGTVYRQKIKGPLGGFRADLRYTEYEKNRRLSFETIKGVVSPTASIDFEPVDDSTSTVHFRWRWEPKGFGKVLAPLLRKPIEGNMHASYDNLVRVLDAHEEVGTPAGGEPAPRGEPQA